MKAGRIDIKFINLNIIPFFLIKSWDKGHLRNYASQIFHFYFIKKKNLLLDYYHKIVNIYIW